MPEVVTPQEVGGVGDGGRWCHGRLTGSRGRVGPGRWVAYDAAVDEAVSGGKRKIEKPPVKQRFLYPVGAQHCDATGPGR